MSVFQVEGWHNSEPLRDTVACMDDVPNEPGVYETSPWPLSAKASRGFQYWDGAKFGPIRPTVDLAYLAPRVQSFAFPRPFWRPMSEPQV
jgi:hypothetical protein